MALPGFHRFIEEADYTREWVHHEPFPHQSGTVGKAIGISCGVREEQQTRRTNRVCCKNYDVGHHSILRAASVTVDRPSGPPMTVVRYLAHARACDELCPRSLSSRPMGQVD